MDIVSQSLYYIIPYALIRRIEGDLALHSANAIFSTEVWAILILGSVPTVRPLFLHLFRNVISQASSSTYGRGSSFRPSIPPGRLSSQINTAFHSSDTAKMLDKREEFTKFHNQIALRQLDSPRRVMVTTDVVVESDQHRGQ